jgi:transposase
MGLSVEAVRKPPKPIPEKVAKVWAEEGPRRARRCTGRGSCLREGMWPYLVDGWLVGRTSSWLGQNRRMSKDYERPRASAEAFVSATIIRLMLGRLARG